VPFYTIIIVKCKATSEQHFSFYLFLLERCLRYMLLCFHIVMEMNNASSQSWQLVQEFDFPHRNASDKISPERRQRRHPEAPRGRADLRVQGRPGHVRHAHLGARGSGSSPEAAAVPAAETGAAACVARPVLVDDRRCTVGPGRRK
jgi:hypothetical protein